MFQAPRKYLCKRSDKGRRMCCARVVLWRTVMLLILRPGGQSRRGRSPVVRCAQGDAARAVQAQALQLGGVAREGRRGDELQHARRWWGAGSAA